MENANKRIFKKAFDQVKAFSCRDFRTDETDSVIIFGVIDLFVSTLFLAVTTFAIMSTRKTNMFYYENLVEKHFIDRAVFNDHGFEMTLNKLVTVDDWWLYIESTFVESLSQFGFQNNEDNITALEANVFLGVPRLRQFRIKNETCLIHNAFRNQFRTCYGKYSKNNEDIDGFFNKTYLKERNIFSYPIWGKLASYYGAGYVEKLSLSLDEIENMLAHLKSESWIDRGTRAILIEFVTYSANINLLCNTKILTEISPSGGILTSSSIQPLRYSILCETFLECFCSYIFSGLIIFYTFEILLRVSTFGLGTVFYCIWTILDVIVVLLGYISFFYTRWHTKYLKEVLDEQVQITDDIFTFDVICYWYSIFNNSMGICVFLLWIKPLKYFQQSQTMLQFSKTIKKCAGDIFGFSIMFAIVFFAYADVSVLLFGAVHADFRDFPTAMLTMMRMVLGDLYYSEMEEANPVLGPVFFLSYILFVFFILLNMFLAIINDTYSGITAEITIGQNEIFGKFTKIMMNKLKYFFPKTEISSGNELANNLSKKDLESKNNQESNWNELDLWFEVLDNQNTAKELSALNQRIILLEQIIDNFEKHLNGLKINEK